MAKTETKVEVAATKKIKCRVLDEHGDLVWTILEVPNTPEDKRKPYDPKTETVLGKRELSMGTIPASKDDKVTVTGV